MYKYSKELLSDYLNRFSWDFKKIFLERSDSFNLTIKNHVIEPISINTDSWFSLLSRTKDKTYFMAGTDIDTLEHNIKIFRETYFLDWTRTPINCDNKDIIEFKQIDFFDDIAFYSDILKEIDEQTKDIDFLESVELRFSVWFKQFVTISSKTWVNNDNNKYTSLIIILTWKKWDKREMWYEIESKQHLDSKYFNKELLNNKLKLAIKELEQILDADKAPTWEMDVLISSSAGWTIIHEAVWHWLEADLQNSSWYKWKLNTKVASDIVTVIDDPLYNKNYRWYYKYDHEWVKSSKTVLIDKWILKTYMHNEETAKLFNTESTGNSRAESYRYKSQVRMSNTYLANWEINPEDILKTVKNWLFVEKMWWWSVNPATWDFIFDVSKWYTIKNWKKDKLVSWAIISWNWPEVLMNIKAIWNDLDYFDAWTCGKNWQWMPVTDANPTILVKLKVSAK